MCFKVDYTRQCRAKIVVFMVVAIVGKPLMSHFFKIPTVKSSDSDFTKERELRAIIDFNARSIKIEFHSPLPPMAMSSPSTEVPTHEPENQ